jgi:hypothetical protein
METGVTFSGKNGHDMKLWIQYVEPIKQQENLNIYYYIYRYLYWLTSVQYIYYFQFACYLNT